MDDLLPHFERELAYLRGHAKSFAERYPKIAGRLMLRGDVAEDPHVERLIESFALLAARVHKRLDDDFPLFTETLLDVLYPHYLRPFPSCSVAQFDLGSGVAQMSSVAILERGTVLHSRAVQGVVCKMRTTQNVKLAPVRISEARHRSAQVAPPGTALPPDVASILSLQVELLSAQASWATLNGSDGVPRLRVYLDGEPSLVSVLREALCGAVAGAWVQRGDGDAWAGPFSPRPEMVGFADDEALIDFDERSHAAYRLLTEYFAFPEKFNFVDLPIPISAALGEARSLVVHFALRGVRADSNEARLLDTVQARHFALGCSPVVNLFQQPADPIRITHASTSYPVLPDSRRAFGYEVYSIDRVYRVKQTAQGESIDEFHPFFSLRHDDLLGPGQQAGGAGCYWYARRDDDLAQQSPGYETELSIVDVHFNPSVPQTETLSIQVTATNRDLPSLLPVGSPGGDLHLDGGGVAREIRLLRKPTAVARFERGRGALWRLISHLSLNHLSLSGGGADALKEMLRLYDLPRSASNQRQIEAVGEVAFRPATAWLAGQPFPTFVRGAEVRLQVDEKGFIGTGLQLFASVLERFFSLYVHANSFTQLTLVSARTHEEVLKCPPRNGETALV
ncbi:type VI secretion system baseplate subunit TssF [Aquabacterium sp.]|uniref:type VI secretion system baseplate subunit TssF n=1 Tax=Aquabacterium sp. TaxID=1872578 RepID=UPI0035B29654